MNFPFCSGANREVSELKNIGNPHDNRNYLQCYVNVYLVNKYDCSTPEKNNYSIEMFKKVMIKKTKMNKLKKTVIESVMEDKETAVLNEEWNNFVKRIGEVGNIVKDLASGDKDRSEAATILADKYLEGKVILDEDVQLTVKSDRTVINKQAFKSMENQGSVRKLMSCVKPQCRNNFSFVVFALNRFLLSIVSHVAKFTS